MSNFAELNGLVQGPDGVFCSSSDRSKFDYSDGEEIETSLFNILSNASDLSSSSAELQSNIVDWPTEYHLSETRANLLRPFNLSGVRRVLELGCGCGSISRYLGEIEGVELDSVEGSAARAGLAALRCRDLDNVSISVANFNQAKIPENYYDLVLFVGVTEYAGRFSDSETDQQALQDLLALAKKATNHDGVTLIGIENRLGLKYMLGANEDHYGLRYVGLDNYVNSTGIRTYSKPEWEREIALANFASCDFVYPFPDYKVPTVMITENANHQAVVGALEGVKSRDYREPFDLGESEHRAWQGLLEAGNFADHANSFLIVLSDSHKSVKRLCEFDLSVYHRPELAYLAASDQPTNKQRLRSQIENLQLHTNNLEQKIEFMKRSKGWRLLSVIRRLLGKEKF